LQSVYNYQRVIPNAFTEVVTRVNMAENYRKSIEIKSSWQRSRPQSKSPADFFREPAPNTWTCYSPSVTSEMQERSWSKPNSSNCLPS